MSDVLINARGFLDSPFVCGCVAVPGPSSTNLIQPLEKLDEDRKQKYRVGRTNVVSNCPRDEWHE